MFLASTAQAEDWQQIANLDSNGGVLLFDAAAVTEVQGFRRAWFKAVYTTDQPIPNEYLGSVPANLRSYRSERTLRYFNCPQRTGATMRYYWRGADDERGGYFYQELLTFRPASPGSLDEKMLDTACNFSGEFADAKTAGLSLPGTEEAKAKMLRPVNPGDYYPSGSARRKEVGSPIVRVCVDPSGKLLREPEVTEPSGFPDLDEAAIKVAKATRYKAGTKNGIAVAESCMSFKIKFGVKEEVPKDWKPK